MIRLTGTLLGLALLAAVALLAIRNRPDLATEFKNRRSIAVSRGPAKGSAPITEQQISGLPDPVRRYMRATGNLGKPPIRNMQISFDAQMFQKPGSPPMAGEVRHFSTFDPVRRLFFLPSRMFGLPVAVLHDYDAAEAAMTVRLAGIYDVVDLHSDALARTETVTVLNDMCVFAPSLLIDPRLEWRAIDDNQAAVTFTNGPHQVRATVVFNAEGELVDFFSDDRGALQPDGSLRLLRWSTPMRTYRSFEGRRVPTQGEAVFHYPEGDFAYGRFTIRNIRFDVSD